GGFLGGSGYPEGNAVCVTMLIGHMHKRGTLFTADLVDAQGQQTELYRQVLYSDPHAVNFAPPMLVTDKEHITYECTHDNATQPRLGCEEQPGVTPGVSVLAIIAKQGFSGPLTGAAKLCSAEGPDSTECPPTDDKYPGRTFTGNCVKANLVFGFT